MTKGLGLTRVVLTAMIFSGIAVAHGADQGVAGGGEAAPQDSRSSIMMLLQNIDGPFVSSRFAEKQARLVIEEKYPPSLFSPEENANVVDAGDLWRVTLTNALINQDDQNPLPTVDGRLTPKHLTVVIRKRDAAVIDIR